MQLNYFPIQFDFNSMGSDYELILERELERLKQMILRESWYDIVNIHRD